jgi:hypoxanthine-DNA glycosylase
LSKPARLRGLPPIAAADAGILILGSFPGAQSLAAAQYYAHPQNRFWQAMAGITCVEARAPYEERVAGLRSRGIALWDVLHSCARVGSLDADIARGSEEPNDFAAFLEAHPRVRGIAFNGKSPSHYFDRFVVPLDLLIASDLSVVVMPSSSPAHAAIRPDALARTWKATLSRVHPSVMAP